MRDKWVLKCSLTDLRSSLGLSMEALAERAYTTNTTIFRIEKTGVIADPALAETLASVFGIPLEDFCSVDFATDRTKAEWERQIERPYQTQPDMDGWYYLVFVRRYEKFGEYSAISPTSWVRNENGRERRRLMVFGPDGIIEHLAEYGVKCAVVVRRIPQQIMDEDCNRPTYNNQHAESRRHVSLDALDPMGDTIVGTEDVNLDFGEDEVSALYEAIRTLDPQQRDLIRKVFWQDIKQVEIAREEGVAEAAVSRRLSRIYRERSGGYPPVSARLS